MIELRALLSEAQADALAQLVKRIGWSEVRANAVDDDEAHTMMGALEELRRGLAEQGYSPR